MNPKRPFIPIQVQAFRRRRWWPILPWALAAPLVVLLLIWLGGRSPDVSTPQPPPRPGTAKLERPPWQLGNPDGRFTLTFYADLECPFCRKYLPLLQRWVADNNADVTLQWHHLPLPAHEPAASAEARLVECVAEGSGQAAFWRAVEWVYAHTRSDGQGLPGGLRYPESTPAVEQCITSERVDAVIRAQATEATKGGVTATPSLRLLDRQTGQSILLQGPIEGDALLSAMDMLAADEPAAKPTIEMPADVVGDRPR